MTYLKSTINIREFTYKNKKIIVEYCLPEEKIYTERNCYKIKWIFYNMKMI